MRAIMIMFDTLRRKSLPPYGNDWIKAPNFERLQKKTVTFDNFYAGSLPCMPARRELHTGRYNFLHRSWGPIEPFDNSTPEILKQEGIYTHLVTDHSHYWEDGGATYQTRYSSWEGFRGQEGDRWKPRLGEVDIPEQLETVKSGTSFKQNWVNRKYQKSKENFSSYKTFKAGLDFIESNKEEDNWFLQIEAFDPHEPFYVPDKFKELYSHDYNGKYFDWPSYQPTTEKKEEIEHVNYEYAASVSMCDNYLGKVLDMMDKYNMWENTMLIINTDHGFLLGEHGWWGKNIQPFYDEIVHLPFFIWDPRHKIKNERRDSLAQTIDIAPTLLDYFEIDIPDNMQGESLSPVVENNEQVRESALFGVHGGHVNITDGKYVYMKGPQFSDNEPLFEYTLMPTNMRNFFDVENLKKANLTEEFNFADKIPLLKVPTETIMSSYRFGDKLFDLETDPEQNKNIEDLDLEIKMIELLRKAMISSEAPDEQYERLGIHKNRNLTRDELIIQKEKKENSLQIDIGEEISIDKKAKQQLLFVKSMLTEELKYKLEEEVRQICKRKNKNYIDEEISMKVADNLLEELNLGDKKQMVLKLVEFANKDK